MKKLLFLLFITHSILNAHVDHVCVDKTKLDQLTTILDQIIGILKNLREQSASLSAEATQRSLDFNAWQAYTAEQEQIKQSERTENSEQSNNQKEDK